MVTTRVDILPGFDLDSDGTGCGAGGVGKGGELWVHSGNGKGDGTSYLGDYGPSFVETLLFGVMRDTSRPVPESIYREEP